MHHLSPLLVQSSGICAERGEGSWLFDAEGHRWLDFTSGIGVTATGHCHPKVVAAAQQQVARLVHAQYTTVTHPNMLRLSDRLSEHLPAGLDAVAFSNSGSEAVETAIRLARHATGRPNLIAFQGGFHGRTLAAASLTSSTTKVRSGWGPMMAGVFFAPFPHIYLYGWDEEATSAFCLRQLDELLLTQSPPHDTAALIIEPVQGEFGYYPAPASFLAGLRERCDRHGILLIADEIQAGYGRTGRFWSHEHARIQPDMVVTAKGLASGYPLSAVAAAKGLMAQGRPGSQGGTYGANAVSCAAALATLEVIEEEDLVNQAAEHGRYLRERLEALARKHDDIDEVRGKGLMLGVEMVRAPGQPDGERAQTLLSRCEQAGLLLLRCGTHGQVVRWLPPLTASRQEIDLAVDTFEDALESSA
ncbi:aspartate aminotransferase family protein [Alloalcanivorax xenomutans]|uniref:Aspartate aminotransferase family protein n=1 Tax=Alloalcanivorax xenomutans TaxID=1094342 RepID=A0A9Q3W5K8_9GAMM|nr:aspartate aminotransferase family protein [Alloalcanivorax xenomutans]MCE7509636.1 aspartate aminotransferase family protein [Alloalcanivorax xenomutans]CUR45168.1 Gamma-aminobutyrate:alpha-ketoglutarate aminotransferase [Alloalcanivorax xenomutans]